MHGNEQAFPSVIANTTDENLIVESRVLFPSETMHITGLTKREYFAAMAMQGFLSNKSIIDNADEFGLDWITEKAFLLSEKMIKASQVQS